MMKIKFDMRLMKFMSLFQNITHSKIKDCIDDGEKLVFIVEQGELFRALGKNAANLKRLENKLKKKVRIIEFSPNKLSFIKKAIAPLKVEDIEEDEETGVITLKSNDTKTKGLLIGRAAKNLRNLEDLARRYFSDITEIKVS